MRISNNLKELREEKALMIVTGNQVAKVYQLKNGKVTQKPTVFIQSPWLTDHEGVRRREGRGTIWGTASDYEQKDDNVKIEFIHALKKELKEILQTEKTVDSLYIFSPSSMIGTVKNLIPKSAQKKINFEYTGNFTKFTPNNLLEKVNKRRTSEIAKKENLAPQTRKILKRKKVHNNSK